MVDVVCALAAEFGYRVLVPTEKEGVPQKVSDTSLENQAQAALAESAKETETCLILASDLRTVRESLNKIFKYAEERRKCSHYLDIPIAEQEQTKNTLLALSKIVLDSPTMALTEQRRSRLRELILKTTKNLENIVDLNHNFCQQLEDISFSLRQ